MGIEPGRSAASIAPARDRTSGEPVRLEWRPYRFELARDMVTSQGAWNLRQGWLLRLETPRGRVGWGEAALPSMAIPPPGSSPPRRTDGLRASRGASQTMAEATDGAVRRVLATLNALPSALERRALERLLPELPAPLACALGMALAELDGLGSAQEGGWLTAPPSALLLPAGEAAIATLEKALATQAGAPSGGAGGDEAAERPGTASSGDPPRGPQAWDQEPAAASTFTVKWKVASDDDALERCVLDTLLERLPRGGRLRLDANGGWDRATAWRWAERLAGEARLDWLEQPLPPDDQAGLEQLAGTLPVALDESLRLNPGLVTNGWRGWQVRRPLAEADPRPLLADLRAGTPRLMLSTALETGIGRRFLHHLAGLQALGPTPTAPGLAPGWRPRGELFAPAPETAWEAAG